MIVSIPPSPLYRACLVLLYTLQLGRDAFPSTVLRCFWNRLHGGDHRRTFPCWVCFGFGLLIAFDGAPITGATSRAEPEAWVLGPVSSLQVDVGLGRKARRRCGEGGHRGSGSLCWAQPSRGALMHSRASQKPLDHHDPLHPDHMVDGVCSRGSCWHLGAGYIAW